KHLHPGNGVRGTSTVWPRKRSDSVRPAGPRLRRSRRRLERQRVPRVQPRSVPDDGRFQRRGAVADRYLARSADRRTEVAMTYSIVARDPQTGQMGVAVQSHWFSVGSVVTWGEAGVGVVATQAFAEPSYGPLGLDLMRGGKSATDALAALTATDPQADRRQVAMIDANGLV